MSASLRKRTSERLPRYVRFVPLATLCAAANDRHKELSLALSTSIETPVARSLRPACLSQRRCHLFRPLRIMELQRSKNVTRRSFELTHLRDHRSCLMDAPERGTDEGHSFKRRLP